MSASVDDPFICTRTEKAALDHVYRSLARHEPCTVIGLNGVFGKELLFHTVADKIAKESGPDKLISSQIFSVGEGVGLVSGLGSEPGRLVLLLDICGSEDFSDIVAGLEKFRTARGTNFTSIIFADLNNVYRAWSSGQKLLVRSPFRFTPLDQSDTESFIRALEQRFSAHLSEEKHRQIFTQSGGHMGLIKSIFLLMSDHTDLDTEPSSLLRLEPVAHRIKNMLKNLPVLQSCSNSDKEILSGFGLYQNNRFFTPLLETYLDSRSSDTPHGWKAEFTPSELEIVHYLRSREGQVVSRDDLAGIIWKEEWQDKYSDWAIDQQIHRLRHKIMLHLPGFSLLTRKGLGYVFVRK